MEDLLPSQTIGHHKNDVLRFVVGRHLRANWQHPETRKDQNGSEAAKKNH
jgi:hypothetical protein